MALKFFLIAISLTASSASAQPNRAVPEAEAVSAMRDFGRCVVRREADQARDVLAMDYRTDAYRQALRALALKERNCLRRGSELRLGGVLMAGSLAEALLADRLGGQPLADAVAQSRDIEGRDLIETAAICVVKDPPGQVSRLLASEPGTDGERAATTTLGDALADCLPSGQGAQVNRLGLRAVLALASYRLVIAAPPASGTPG